MKKTKKDEVFIDKTYAVHRQLLPDRRHCSRSAVLFELLGTRLQLQTNRFLHHPINRLHLAAVRCGSADPYRLRPSPIAASIFASVADAMALAFSAPWSKIASSSGESINSL